MAKRRNNLWAVMLGSMRIYKDGIPVDTPIHYATQFLGQKEGLIKVCPDRDAAQKLARKLSEAQPLQAAA